MFPWLWFWAPHIHFPWSGSVAQQIDPNLGWFFGAIQPRSGDGAVERDAFDVATYGKQLGLINEAVLGLSGRGAVTAVDSLSAQLDALRLSQPAAYAQLAYKFRSSTP